jgi:glyoxylate reductase
LEKYKIFVTRRIAEKGLELLRPHCQMNVWEGELPPQYDVLKSKVRGIDGLLCLLTDRIDRGIIESAGPNLKVISTYAVGVDNIDLVEATRCGIVVGNTPDALTDATADWAFALLMAAARRVVEADHYVHAGKWKTWTVSTLLGADIHGATLGIVGFGRIGQAVARRSIGFDMRVLYFNNAISPGNLSPDKKAKEVDFDFLLKNSDFVSLHVPLTNQTRRMFNQDAFEKMKPGAILINTARGAIVDQAALVNALVSGKLAAAALDVTDPEPLPNDSPLLRLENVIITPHIASASTLTRERMAVMAAQNLLAGLRGERLPFCVNLEVYKKG